MNIKKLLVGAMATIFTLTLTACGKSENPSSQVSSDIDQQGGASSDVVAENSKLANCLPFALEFGDSYEEFANKLKKAGLSDTEIPQLEKAQNNDGYVALPQFYFSAGNTDDYLGYTAVGSDALNLPLLMRFAFSFNQNKELYEWYWFGGDIELDGEARVEYVLNCMLDTYNDLFGFEGSYTETDDKIVCTWETDTIIAELSLSNNILVIVFHSNKYDLNH